MSTHFDNNFDNGDLIDAEHIKQLFKPVEDMESGQSLFRVATGASTADKYVVDFQQAANPGGNRLTSLVEGQTLMFKATLDCNAGADLEVLLEGASAVSGPLTLAGSAIAAGEIKQDQIVSAVYNSAGGGRFDVIGLASSGSGGGTATIEYAKMWRNPGQGNEWYPAGLYDQFGETDHDTEVVGTKLSIFNNHSIEANEAGYYLVHWNLSGSSANQTVNLNYRLYNHATSSYWNAGGDSRHWNSSNNDQNNLGVGGSTILNLSVGDRVGLHFSHYGYAQSLTLFVRYLG